MRHRANARADDGAAVLQIIQPALVDLSLVESPDVTRATEAVGHDARIMLSENLPALTEPLVVLEDVVSAPRAIAAPMGNGRLDDGDRDQSQEADGVSPRAAAEGNLVERLALDLAQRGAMGPLVALVRIQDDLGDHVGAERLVLAAAELGQRWRVQYRPHQAKKAGRESVQT